MADEWYWKHRGETRGPISTEDLDDLIRHHRIDNRDELRPVDSPEWISGEAVKAMFTNVKTSENATVDAAARLLQQRRIPGTNAGLEGSSTGIGDTLVSAAKGLAGLLSGLLDWVITGITTPLFYLRRLYHPWLVLGVAALILISIPLGRLDLTGAENRRIYDRHSHILAQARQLHSEEAPEAEWERLRKEYLNEVKTSQLELNKAALKYANQSRLRQWDFQATNYLARRNLIQLSYTIERLLSIPKEKRTGYLGYADRLFASTTDAITGKTLQQLKLQAASGSNSKKPAASNAGIDPMIAGILVVDALLLVGGGVFVWRRWIRR